MTLELDGMSLSGDVSATQSGEEWVDTKGFETGVITSRVVWIAAGTDLHLETAPNPEGPWDIMATITSAGTEHHYLTKQMDIDSPDERLMDRYVRWRAVETSASNGGVCFSLQGVFKPATPQP